MIRLSAFADEASPMLEGQIAAMKRNGIEYLEIRGVNGENIANISCDDAKKYADQLTQAGIKVWSIGSPIGKVKIDSDLLEHRFTHDLFFADRAGVITGIFQSGNDIHLVLHWHRNTSSIVMPLYHKLHLFQVSIIHINQV